MYRTQCDFRQIPPSVHFIQFVRSGHMTAGFYGAGGLIHLLVTMLFPSKSRAPLYKTVASNEELIPFAAQIIY